MGKNLIQTQLVTSVGSIEPAVVSSVPAITKRSPNILNSVLKITTNNGRAGLALVLSLVLIVAGCLQLAHDHLPDHHHDAGCTLCLTDGSSPIASNFAFGEHIKQEVILQSYTFLSILLSRFEPYESRAPPATL